MNAYVCACACARLQLTATTFVKNYYAVATSKNRKLNCAMSTTIAWLEAAATPTTAATFYSLLLLSFRNHQPGVYACVWNCTLIHMYVCSRFVVQRSGGPLLVAAFVATAIAKHFRASCEKLPWALSSMQVGVYKYKYIWKSVRNGLLGT